MAEPLTAHSTLYTSHLLQSVPPMLRHKQQFYRDHMDPMVRNDTAHLSWKLAEFQSQLLLETLFPEGSLFGEQDSSVSPSCTPSQSPALHSCTSSQSPHPLLDFMEKLTGDGVYEVQPNTARRWVRFPDLNASGKKIRSRGGQADSSERRMANFLNDLLRRAKKFGSNGNHKLQNVWTAAASTLAPTGAEAVRKPDLVLLPKSRLVKRKQIDWRDVLAIGEIKNKESSHTTELSYVEVAGKTGTIFFSQDGRHAVSSLRILGTTAIFSLTDKGGSLSTVGVDIHSQPTLFLHILLGISFSPPCSLGIDSTIISRDDSHKEILVGWQSNESMQMNITVDSVIFASDALHTRGTTVWSGTWQPNANDAIQHVVVKDSWVDPLREYTEGAILKRLNTAGVQGVPRLIHEEQVKTRHPKFGTPVNASTHLLRSLFKRPSEDCYQLRALTRLVTQPTGKSIMEISCLAELIVVYIDYILTHKDALEKTKILHCDITLTNLWIVEQKMWERQELDFLEELPPRARRDLALKIQQLPHRGLLGDWGYSALYQIEQSISDPATVDVPFCQARQRVPVVDIKSDSNEVHYVDVSDLQTRHDIILPMTRDPADAALPRVTFDSLYRTANWSWMAAQLVLAGPGTPVHCTPTHDLESFFYTILGFCLLYDEPHKVKSEEELSQCYDILFNKSSASLDKTTTIQSDIGWTTRILPFMSQYFKPLVPLLHTLRENIIMPLTSVDGKFHNGDITHDQVVGYLLGALRTLDDQYWVPRRSPDTQCTHDRTIEDESEDDNEDEDDEDEDEADGQTPEHTYIARMPPIRARDGPGFTRTRRTIGTSDTDEYQPPKAKRPRVDSSGA